MNKTVLLCEGYNDAVFLHETITRRIAVTSEKVKIYPELRSFIRDVRGSIQFNISIVQLNGPISPKFPIRFVRQFWYIGTYKMSLGLIKDLDRDEIYERMVAYLNEYLNTKCKKHNINPSITFYDSDKKLKMCFKGGRKVIIWTFGIPKSLEVQVSQALREKHQALNSIRDEDETIRAAIVLFKTNRESIIRSSVDLLSNKKWFARLCGKFNARF